MCTHLDKLLKRFARASRSNVPKRKWDKDEICRNALSPQNLSVELEKRVAADSKGHCARSCSVLTNTEQQKTQKNIPCSLPKRRQHDTQRQNPSPQTKSRSPSVCSTLWHVLEVAANRRVGLDGAIWVAVGGKPVCYSLVVLPEVRHVRALHRSDGSKAVKARGVCVGLEQKRKRFNATVGTKKIIQRRRGPRSPSHSHAFPCCLSFVKRVTT